MTVDRPSGARRLGFGFWAFVVFMSALTALWVGLGVWQLNRLAWKEGLIAEVSDRLMQPPLPLPAVDKWDGDLSSLSYHPVQSVGQFLPDKTVLVFTALSDAKGKYDGPGYWVMTPFEPDAGGTVFVNRGFVPQAQSAVFAAGQGTPTGTIILTGVARDPEQAGMFTPAPDTAHRIEWVRNPVRLAKLDGVGDAVFPMFVDAPAGTPGSLPQGGETEVDFPNNHLGYALTWFGFAILTPCLLAFWIYRQVRPSKP